MKSLHIAVRVRTDGAGRPTAFFHQGRWHGVSEVLDAWCERGRWWEGEGARAVYRVATSAGAVYELGCEDGKWQLYTVLD